MNIYLIRHSKAEKASAVSGDFERKLTEEGKHLIKAAAEKWKHLVDSFDYIVSSPLVRAHQTAKIIADVFDHKDEIILDKNLGSGGSVEDIINTANSLDGEDIAFIGHQPDLSNYLSAFISSSGAHAEFKPAAIAKISFHNRAQVSKGYLEFLIPAEVLK